MCFLIANYKCKCVFYTRVLRVYEWSSEHKTVQTVK